MDLLVLLKGIVIGFIITAPIGPVAIFCIDRTLSKGRLSGFISGMGAVTADGIYCVVAAYGITVVSDFLQGHQHLFRIVGGIFLLFVGIKIVLSKPPEKAHLNHGKGLIADYLSAFIVTLTNPLTVIAFIAIFAGLGLGSSHRGHFSATTMVVGVILGAALCWFLLSSWVNIFRNKFKGGMLQTVRKVFGVIILIIAVVAIF